MEGKQKPYRLLPLPKNKTNKKTCKESDNFNQIRSEKQLLVHIMKVHVSKNEFKNHLCSSKYENECHINFAQKLKFKARG